MKGELLKHNKTHDESNTDLGTRLRYAREALGLTQRDISNRLKLTVQTIGELERNDYSRLAGEMFVRGYLRAYAQVVNIPSIELQLPTAVNPAGSSIPTVPAQSAHHYHQEQMTTKSRSIRWITYAIATLLVVLVLIAWRNQSAAVDEPLTQAVNLNLETSSIIMPVGYDAKPPLRGVLRDPVRCAWSFVFCELVADEVVLID